MNLRRTWGEAVALFDRSTRFGWIDLLIGVALAGVFYGLLDLGQQWTQPHRPSVEIDLSPWALPRYTFYSLCRGLLAYILSLLFTLIYGYWAAKDQVAERVLIPLLDILQSLPVLAFLPGLLLGLTALFPGSNIGVELAAVLMIFTGQAWNMTFSFYHSVRSVPMDQQEVGTIYGFGWWQRFRWVELPYSTMGLVWNSMMSMAGGWFFLTVCESFKLRTTDFRLAGVGSYMSVAVDANDYSAMVWAILAMVLMIVLLDQLLWRPVVVWAQKFRVEEGGFQVAQTSWFLAWLRRSRVLHWLSDLTSRVRHSSGTNRVPVSRSPSPGGPSSVWAGRISLLVFLLLLLGLGYGAWHLVGLISAVGPAQWGELVGAAFATLGRVLLTVAIGTLWAVPAGLAIGLSPRLSTWLQPVVQVVASFPAPMLFPIVILVLKMAGVSLNWGSILLMLLGTQWYILFNVIAGAMAIPADLKEMARSYNIGGWRRFCTLFLPSVFPYLVTGWITAAGGAWNTSIVAEYVTTGRDTSEAAASPAPGASSQIEDKGQEVEEPTGGKEVMEAWGLGAIINKATEKENYALLAASVLVMSTMVVVFNRTVWRYCYRLAEERYSLNK